MAGSNITASGSPSTTCAGTCAPNIGTNGPDSITTCPTEHRSGYVMTLPDGGYIARLEDTQAWYAGPYDSESDAFENLFRLIARYHSVDDPPAHARGIEGPFDERKEASRLCETQAAATGESLGWYAWPARDAVRQTMDLADMLDADTPTTRTSPSA